MDQQLPLTSPEQMVSPFTPEDDRLITKLFAEGHTMKAIGEQLKRSRGSIAGRIRRLRAKLNPETPPPEPRIRLRMIDEKSTEVTLQELKLHHCRWPKGDPRHSDFRFCGAKRISESERTPYCREHTLIAGRQYSGG